eukprot:TRINITY_DN9189_c0_g2_i1.p1 TRINITY_DN9189_c0_g2~~TRINITY_DN9189_c0_g2_i1.p1  ORF type:complete len:824 (+),score=134.45 TRINITY_DN9189_c0_g2_i1:100-2571(+)
MNMHVYAVLLLLPTLHGVGGSFANPVEISEISPTEAHALQKQDEYLYTTTTSKVTIYNVSQPTPVKVVEVPCQRPCLYFSSVLVDGDWMFVGYGGVGNAFNIYDISTRETPQLVSTTSLTGLPMGVRREGQSLYVFTASGIEVMDIVDHANPVPGYVLSLARLDDLFIKSNTGYGLTTQDGSLHIIDLSSPTLASSTFNISGAPEHIWVKDEFAFITHRSSQGIEVFNLSGTSPTLVGANTETMGTEGLWLDEGTQSLYVADQRNGMKIFDVSQPIPVPVLLTSWLPMDGTNITASDVTVDNGIAYLAAELEDRIFIIDVSIAPTLAPPTLSPPTPSPPTLTPPTLSPPTLSPPTPYPPSQAPPTLSPPTLSPATPAPGTPSPLVSANPTATLTQDDSSSAPTLSSRTETLGNTAGGVSSVAGLVGSNAGVSVMRSMSIARGVLCTESDDDPLPRVMHPLGFTVDDSNWAGCVVGNTILCAGLPAVLFLAYTVMKVVHGGDATKAASAVRYPSLVAPFQMLLMPSIVECAFHLLLNGSSRTVGYGVLGVATVVLFVVVLTLYGFTDTTKCRLMRPEASGSRLKSYFLGGAAWASIHPGYVEGRGVLFESFENLTWLRGQHYLVEFGHVIPLSILAAVPRLGRTGCIFKAGGMTAIMLLQTGTLLYVRCFVAGFLQHLTVLTCAALCLSLACATTSFVVAPYYDEAMWENLALGFLEASLMLTLVRAVYDTVLFFADLTDGYRKLLVAKATAEASDININTRKTSFWGSEAASGHDVLEQPLMPIPLEPFSPLEPPSQKIFGSSLSGDGSCSQTSKKLPIVFDV